MFSNFDKEHLLFLKILAIGCLASVGKLLAGDEAITVRKFIGRAITGSITAVTCFAIFLHNESISELAVIGLAALIGILGSSTIEYFIVTYFDKKMGAKKTTEEEKNNNENE